MTASIAAAAMISASARTRLSTGWKEPRSIPSIPGRGAPGCGPAGFRWTCPVSCAGCHQRSLIQLRPARQLRSRYLCLRRGDTNRSGAGRAGIGAAFTAEIEHAVVRARCGRARVIQIEKSKSEPSSQVNATPFRVLRCRAADHRPAAARCAAPDRRSGASRPRMHMIGFAYSAGNVDGMVNGQGLRST